MFSHFRSSRIGKTDSTKYRLHTADRVQRPGKRCRLSSMQTDKKNWFFFSVVRKVVTFDFIKFSFSRTLLAYAVFFTVPLKPVRFLGRYYCLGDSREGEGGNESLGGFSIYPGMGRCGPAPDLTKTFE